MYEVVAFPISISRDKC